MKKIVLFFVAMVVSLATFEQEVTPVVEVTTMDELKAHAGETIIYKGLEPIVEAGFMGMNSYFMPDSETMLYCELANTLPARFDAKGIYSAEEGMFAVQEFVAIYAFNTVSDLNMFLLTSNPTEEQKAASYEIKSSFVVTYVDGNFGKIYAQYEGKDPYMGRPMTCGIELGWGGIAPRSGEAIANPGMLAAGDEILVSGVYSPAQYDEEGNLTAAEAFVANTITRVSQNNALEATALSAIEEGTYSYVSGYVMINNVAVAAHETIPGAWTITDSYNGSITVTQCGPNTNLTEYVGKTLDKYLVGVLAYQPAVGGYIFYAIEIKESKEYFDNIAALVATGPRSGGLSTALRNPVVVNYIYYDQWGGYTLFVEDATGVLVVKGIGVMDDEGNYTFPYEVEVGDSILGIDGFIEEGCKMWSGVDYNIDVNLTYVSEGVVNEIDVTLEALLADQEAWQEASWNGEAYASPYANRIVKLTNLTLEETDDDATSYWVQGESKLEFNPKKWVKLGFEMPANVATLTGIADYDGLWNYSFTIIPTAVEAAAGDVTNVEYAEIGNIYTENGLIVAEGEFQIFTVTGQNVTNMNGNLANGVYVVRTANATAKVVIK